MSQSCREALGLCVDQAGCLIVDLLHGAGAATKGAARRHEAGTIDAKLVHDTEANCQIGLPSDVFAYRQMVMDV
jgi:hypothetical protein